MDILVCSKLNKYKWYGAFNDQCHVIEHTNPSPEIKSIGFSSVASNLLCVFAYHGSLIKSYLTEGNIKTEYWIQIQGKVPFKHISLVTSQNVGRRYPSRTLNNKKTKTNPPLVQIATHTQTHTHARIRAYPHIHISLVGDIRTSPDSMLEVNYGCTSYTVVSC